MSFSQDGNGIWTADGATEDGDVKLNSNFNAISTNITNIAGKASGTASSTGVLTGGVLSTGAGSNQYSISDGTGLIVSEAGVETAVSWSGKTNIVPANIATNLLTWVGINSSGNVVEKTSPFTPSEARNTIVLGVAVHVNLVDVDVVNNEQVVAYQPLSTAYDIAEALGFVNISGNEFSANGANLSINKSAGVMFKIGCNYDIDSTNPHNKTLVSLSPATFQYRFSDGSNGTTGTVIDPNNLDDGAGGLTALANNQWSIQRIYSFVSNNVKIQRGVESFATKAAAIEGINSENYVTEPSIAANGLLRGWLVVKKGATDLSGVDAQFLPAPKFGEGSTGGGSTPPGDAADIVINAKKATAGTINVGQVVVATGWNGVEMTVELADADVVASTPAMGIVRETITDTVAGRIVFSGVLSGIDTSSFSVQDELYISTTPGTLTNVRPTSLGAAVQSVGRVLSVNAVTGTVMVAGAGRVNDIPNFTAADKYWYGDATAASVEGTITAAGRAILDDADATAQRATLGLVIGTDVLANVVEDTTPQLGGTLDANSNDIDNARSITHIAEVDNGNSGTADTIDWGAGQHQKTTMTDNCTYTFTAPDGPCVVVFKVMQDAFGGHVATWPTSVNWPGGTPTTLTAAANAVDLFSFYFDGTDYNFLSSSLNLS